MISLNGKIYFLNKNFFQKVIPILLFLLFSSLSSAEQALVNKYGGTLVRATTSDPRSFNAITAKETSTTDVTGYIFEGLTRIDGVTTQVEPNLAERWQISGNGLEWIFYLRRDVLWTDGQPFIADDVVFTFNELIYNDSIASSSRDIFTIEGQIFKVEKIDDYTVKFTLPVRFAPFLKGMTQEILPKHILKAAVDRGEFNFTWGIDTDPQKIIGTGPYQLVEYRPGERLVFERNPNYWRKSAEGDSLPYIQKIIHIIIQNHDVALLKFLDKELDVTALQGVDFPLLKPLEQKGNFQIFDVGPDFGTNFITFNQNSGKNPKTNEPFVDPKKLAWFTNLDFRKAAAHAIDKEKIIQIVLSGLGYPQDAAMSPAAEFFYNPDVTKYEYDLEKARAILTKAGFVDRDNDGIIEDPKGNPVEFNLYTNSGATERVQIASIIRHDLQQLGMKINFLPLEFNNLVGKLTATFDWDAIILGLTGGTEPHFGKTVWSSDGELHMWYPKQEKPATDWEKRTDEIFNLGVQELDEKKRKKLYDEHQRIVSEQLPMIYTVLSSTLFAIRNKFENIHPTSFGGVFHNIEEIYIKPEFK